MRILAKEKISAHRYKTPEGYLVCVDAILARTGKQQYRHNELFSDSSKDDIVDVDRPYEEVFNEKTIASFENKPFVNEHPHEDVNVYNHRDYAVGFVRDVHEGQVDGEPVLLGNIIVTDEEAIADIESGNKLELSCGYDCDIADEENLCQRNIRGNHVALCKAGRAGIARIIDSKVEDSSVHIVFKPFDSDKEYEKYKYANDYNIKQMANKLNVKADVSITRSGWNNQFNNMKIDVTGDKNQIEKLINYCITKLNLEIDKKQFRDSKVEDVDIKNRKTRLLKIFKQYNYNRDDAIAEVNSIKGIDEDDIATLVDWIVDIYKDFYTLKDSIEDSAEDDFYDDLFSSNLKYEFIKGGYGIKFKTTRDYQKAKEMAKQNHYTKGHWHDKDLEFFEYGGTTISNEDSIKDWETKDFSYKGFDIYKVGKFNDDLHYEVRYNDKVLYSYDENEYSEIKKDIDKIKVETVTKYGITTLEKWESSYGRAKPERVYTDLKKAEQEKSQLEKADKIPYQIFEISTHTFINGRKIDSMEEIVKDKLENKQVKVRIKFDSNKEANDALKMLHRKEDFIDSDLIFDDTIEVKTTDVLVDTLKKALKMYFIKNIKVIHQLFFNHSMNFSKEFSKSKTFNCDK